MLIPLLLLAQTPDVASGASLAELRAQVEALRDRVDRLQASGPLFADDFIPEGGDLADALEAIQRSDRCGRSDAKRGGCRVALRARVYEIGRPIVLCQPMVITGQGGWGRANTEIVTRGQTAFHVARADFCEDRGFGGGTGGWSVIEHLALRDRGGVSREPDDEPIRSAGVWMEARAHVSHVWVDGFTQGVRIHAGAKRGEGVVRDDGWRHHAGTNANGWALSYLLVTNSRHSGVFIDGPDTNAGVAIGVYTSTNCRHGDRYDARGWRPCANIYDSSFLGNTWIAPHSSYAIDRRGNAHHQYLTDSKNSRNVFVGAYAETGNGVSRASARDLVLGGLSGWDRDAAGVVLQDGSINRLCSEASTGDGRVCIGRAAGRGVIQFSADELPTVRLKPETERRGERRFWRLDLDNLDRAVVGRLAPDGTWHQRLRARLPRCPNGEAEAARVERDGPVGYVVEDQGNVSLCAVAKKR